MYVSSLIFIKNTFITSYLVSLIFVIYFSSELQCSMKFAIYLPPQSETGLVPVIFWLSGLTCNELNFIQKAGAQKYAAHHGIAVVCPDTSPSKEILLCMISFIFLAIFVFWLFYLPNYQFFKEQYERRSRACCVTLLKNSISPN